MPTLGERIKRRREQLGLTQAELAKKAGVTQGAISKVERGDRAQPKTLPQIAKALEISIDALVYGEPSNVESGPEISGMVPVLSWVSAGRWGGESEIYIDENTEWIPCPKAVSRGLFALRVRGESMEPKFSDGDMVYVDPNAYQDDGRIVIAASGDAHGATMKKLVYFDGKPYLKPLNPDWPGPKLIAVDGDMRVIGVVVGKWVDC